VTDHSPEAGLPDLQLVIDRQKALGRRLMWLLMVPFIMTGALVYMFIVVKNQISNVQTSSKLIQIESILEKDSNYAWGIHEYENIAKSHKSAPILARLGTLYFLANPNDSARAISTLLEANRIDPQAWEPYRALTFVFSSIDRPKEALETGRKAIELNPLDANAYNNLAWVCSHTQDSHYRDLKAALIYAENAVGYTNRKEPDYLDTLAQVYIQFQDSDSKSRAEELLKKAVLISPNDRKSTFVAHFREYFPQEKLED
jgi:tetratricopeptide (TPR) repeat protein